MAKIISSLPGSTSVLLRTSQLINDGSDNTSTYVETDELGVIAFSNDYNDLDNLPIIGDGITNLNYTPSPTQGTITSDTGTDAVIPLADVTNAGLLSPAEKVEIASAIQPSDLAVVATTGDYGDLLNPPQTKAEFNTELTDGDFLFVGDVTQYTDNQARDAIGNILIDSTTIDFSYNDIPNTISAAIKPNSITTVELADDYQLNLGFTPENVANKQNSLAVDGTGTKYPTVDAVNAALQTGLEESVKLTGNQTISGQKSFSLTGKIDMQTNNAFPAISVTTLGSNGQSAAEFINSSSFPNSNALRLQTGSSGGVGNMALNVSNQSSIGIGIFSKASNGGVSISSQSSNGDSYISNITLGGTGRNYVGRSNGTETYSVDKIGNVRGNSYIKRSAPATNILLAGGGDIAQNTAFNKNFGTTAGTVVEGGTLGSNAYSSTAYLPLSGGEIIGSIRSMATEPIAGKVTDNTPYRMYEDGVNVKYGIGLSSSGGINYMANQEAAATSHRFYGGRNNDNPKLLLSIDGDGNLDALGTVTATNFNGSATLIGTPTAPTAAVGTNTTQIATMAALQAAKQDLQSVLEKGSDATIWSQNGFNKNEIYLDVNNTNQSLVIAGAMYNIPDVINARQGGFSITDGNPEWYRDINNNKTSVRYTDPIANSILLFPAKSEGTYNLATLDDFSKRYTVSSLPTPTGSDPVFAIVTDATTPTYLGTLTGGGTVVCPVFYNGSAWVAH